MPGPTLVTGKVAWGSGSCSSGCTSQATTAITSQTAGHMNLVSLSFCANVNCNATTSAVTLPVPTDGAGNLYTQVYREDGPLSNVGIAIFANTNIASSASNVITCNTTQQVWYLACNASEWSGANGTAGNLVDQSGFVDSASFGTTNPVSFTTLGNTTNANESAYAVGTAAGVNLGTGSGFTQVTSDPNMWDEWKAVASAGSSVTALFSNPGTAITLLAVVITMNPAGLSFTPEEDFWVTPSPAPTDTIISVF